MTILTHFYGGTTLFGGWLGFLYGAVYMNEREQTANCHYGLTIGTFFLGLVFATDSDNFDFEE